MPGEPSDGGARRDTRGPFYRKRQTANSCSLIRISCLQPLNPQRSYVHNSLYVPRTGAALPDKVRNSYGAHVLDQLVGKYVLVELKYRTDNLIGPNTLIRIQPVETRVGTVSALDGNTMTIDGKDYAVPEDLTLPMVYVNARVLYHFDDNGLQGIERLSVKKGTLSGWDAQTQEMAIRPENGYSPSLYTLSPLADEETVAYLRSYFSGACRSVCYYFDDKWKRGADCF